MKKIYIFSLGYAGRAIFKKLKADENYEILGFIDNNDELVGSEYKGYKIHSAKKANELECDYFALGGIWADDMEAQLLALGIPEKKILAFGARELDYNTPQREKITDEVIKRLDLFMRRHDIGYFLCNSSLLAVLRGNALSKANDVDLYVTNYADIEFLAKELKNEFKDFIVSFGRYQKDSILRKAGDISRIAIANDAEDRINIDIGLYERYKDFFIAPYDSGEYFYIPKEYFEGYSRLEYKDFSISVLARYDEYLSYMYGANYMEVPKRFTKQNYLNLGDKEKIDKLNSGEKKGGGC